LRRELTSMVEQEERKLASEREVNKVVKSLREQIYSGLRMPRERLIEVDLAKEYGVSRMTVRQALRQLNYEGLVNIEPFKGARVMEVSLQQLSDRYYVLAVLEGAAAGLAATKVTATDLDELEKNLRAQRDLHPHDVKKWQDLNYQFHRLINLRCGNQSLIDLIRKNSRFTSYWFILLSTPGRIEVNIQEHDSILRALAERSPGKARELVEEHIMGAGRYLVELWGGSQLVWLPSLRESEREGSQITSKGDSR